MIRKVFVNKSKIEKRIFPIQESKKVLANCDRLLVKNELERIHDDLAKTEKRIFDFFNNMELQNKT